jgi:very-short-patch-repair endonuclease
MRSDSTGRRRWLDAYFDPYHLVVEVDCAAHMQTAAWWADLDRSNGLAIQRDSVLRFPSWRVRENPADVASVIEAALRAL